MSGRGRPRPGPLYAIADVGVLGVEATPAAVVVMAEEGVQWIQLRAKAVTDATRWSLAEACMKALEGSSARLWLDDRADIAMLLPLYGVHLGQEDLPPRVARALVGEELTIGFSTHDEAQCAAADADPAVDVVAFGPIFSTQGKERPDPVVGLDRLRAARQQTSKPLVAIGGIDASNLGAVLAQGAEAAAVLGAVCRGDVRLNCRRLLAAA